MPQMISYGNEMIRINTAKNTIEYSTNNGLTWLSRYSGSSCGSFIDILPYGNELLAATDKGVYRSSNKGLTWLPRYTGSSCGSFNSLADGGKEVLAQTSKGLYYSTNSGLTWLKRS